MPVRVRLQLPRHGGLRRALQLHGAALPDLRGPVLRPRVEGEADPGPVPSRSGKTGRVWIQGH